MSFVANFMRCPAVQNFWKSVKIGQSYRQSKRWELFWDTVYIRQDGHHTVLVAVSRIWCTGFFVAFCHFLLEVDCGTLMMILTFHGILWNSCWLWWQQWQHVMLLLLITIRPHRSNYIRRCGLLLLTEYCGLFGLSVRHGRESWKKMAETIEMLLHCWVRWAQRSMFYYGGAHWFHLTNYFDH